VSIFDVQHQPRAHRIIQEALTSKRMPHAYLFAGPEGVGKEMLAVGLAKTLLCSLPVHTSHGQDACGHCEDCLLVDADTHPDLFLIYRQLNKQHPDSTIRKQRALTLSVEVIRHFLVERAGTYPVRGRARIFIIREAERMNDAAQNSLLKTLEEPPPSTFLILLSSSLDRMLATTRSRCQQVIFQSLPADFVAQRLKALRPTAQPDELAYAAQHAGGSLGAARRYLEDGLFAMKQSWGQRLIELAKAPAGFAPHALAKPFESDAKILAKNVSDRDPEVTDTDALRSGLQTLFSVLADFYVDAIRKASGASLHPINADQPEVLQALVTELNVAAMLAALRVISQADANLGRNANIELTLEAMFIQLAKTQESALLV
jgi:DNA polymerase-3 subunit delta'